MTDEKTSNETEIEPEPESMSSDGGDATQASPPDDPGHGDHDGADHHDDHDDHHHGPTGWRYWLYTTDHKVIGKIYLAHGLFFFVLGGLLALLFRTELALGPEAALFEMGTFNSFVTIHGITMIFLVILPLSGAFFNYVIPLMIGCEEMAYPRMNALGAWGISAGGLLVYLPFLTYLSGLGPLTGLASAAGWFHFAPLSIWEAGIGVDTVMLGILVFGITSTGGAINFGSTIVNERHESMGWLDLPPFIWAVLFTNALAIFAVPFLLAAWGMTFMERNWGFVFFDAMMGGAPLLYQWVFWIFGHPEVYILVLPAMGIVAEIVSRFSERPLYGYRPYIASLLVISVASCMVWAHHMYNTGLGASRLPFMVFSMTIAIAFGVYLFSMIATMWKGRVHLTTPMILSIAVIVGLVYSGMEGLMLGQPSLNQELHNTYFVVGHFHFTVFMVGLVGLFAGIYYWYPLMFGRMYNTALGKFHAAVTLAGLPVMFLLMGRIGDIGMMRRYATYAYMPELHFYHMLITGVAFVVALGQAAFLFNLVYSYRYGQKVDNPWEDLMEDQPAPSWYGMPYRVPTPSNIHGDLPAGQVRDDEPGVVADGAGLDGPDGDWDVDNGGADR